jgi:hypothetical protein
MGIRLRAQGEHRLRAQPQRLSHGCASSIETLHKGITISSIICLRALKQIIVVSFFLLPVTPSHY